MNNLYKLLNVSSDMQFGNLLDRLDLNPDELIYLESISNNVQYSMDEKRQMILEMLAGSDNNYQIMKTQFKKSNEPRRLKESVTQSSPMNMNDVLELNELIELSYSKCNDNPKCAQDVYQMINKALGKNVADAYFSMVRNSVNTEDNLKFDTDLVIDGKNVAESILTIKSNIINYLNSVEETSKENVNESSNQYNKPTFTYSYETNDGTILEFNAYKLKDGNYHIDLLDSDFNYITTSEFGETGALDNNFKDYVDNQDWDNIEEELYNKIVLMDKEKFADEHNFDIMSSQDFKQQTGLTPLKFAKKYPIKSKNKELDEDTVYDQSWYKVKGGKYPRKTKEGIICEEKINKIYNQYKEIVKSHNTRLATSEKEGSHLWFQKQLIKEFVEKYPNSINEYGYLNEEKITYANRIAGLYNPNTKEYDESPQHKILHQISDEQFESGWTRYFIIDLKVRRMYISGISKELVLKSYKDLKNKYKDLNIDMYILDYDNNGDVETIVLDSNGKRTVLENKEYRALMKILETYNYKTNIIGVYDINNNSFKELGKGEEHNLTLKDYNNGNVRYQIQESYNNVNCDITAIDRGYAYQTMKKIKNYYNMPIDTFNLEFRTDDGKKMFIKLDNNGHQIFENKNIEHFTSEEIHNKLVQERKQLKETYDSLINDLEDAQQILYSTNRQSKYVDIINRYLKPYHKTIADLTWTGDFIDIIGEEQAQEAVDELYSINETCSAGVTCAGSVATVSKPMKSKKKRKLTVAETLFLDMILENKNVSQMIDGNSYKLKDGYFYKNGQLVKTKNLNEMVEFVLGNIELPILEGFLPSHLDMLLEAEMDNEITYDDLTPEQRQMKQQEETELQNELNTSDNVKVSVKDSNDENKLETDQQLIGVDSSDEQNKKYVVKNPSSNEIKIMNYDEIELQK